MKDLGLSTSVCAAMSPDRDLIHADASVRANAIAYVKHCIDAAQTIGATNVVGPLYSAVGRTWQATADERKKDLDLLVGELKDLARYAGERGVVICVEPLNRFETSFLNLASQAIEVVDRVDHPGVRPPARHVPHEHRGTVDRRRHPGGRRADEAPARVRERPWRAGIGPHRVGRSRRRRAAPSTIRDRAVIESFTLAVKSIARAAAIWRPLAPTQDGLAQDGLKFLRSKF